MLSTSSPPPGRRTGLRLRPALIRPSTASGEAKIEVSHNDMMNSSPPQRASQSPSLTLRLITRATWRMQTSPAWWPWVSFMALNPSRSTTATVRIAPPAFRPCEVLAQALLALAAVGQPGKVVCAGEPFERADSGIQMIDGVLNVGHELARLVLVGEAYGQLGLPTIVQVSLERGGGQTHRGKQRAQD